MQYIIICLLGVAFHSFLKMDNLSKQARAANIPFNWIKDYIVKDVYALLASACSALVWYFIFDEVAAKYPSVANFAKFSFFVMGFMGSYVLQLMLSKAQKMISSIVDYKTNIADGVVPPVNSENVKDVADAAKEDKL